MKHCGKGKAHLHHHHHECPVSLDKLVPGEFGIIQRVQTEGPVRQRLMDLGVIEGAEIEVIKIAPLGDPVQVKVMNSNIALRRDEAETLLIHRHGMKCKAGKHGRRHSRFGWKPKQR